MLPLESVPNVSEGRDADAIEAIGSAFAGSARLLDVHSDPDHNRSVYTLVGTGGDDALVESLLAGIRAACERVDLRRHEGVHPRVGAADVVPLVPLRPRHMPRAVEAARSLGRRVAEELALPVFLYGEAGEGRRPAFFRRGGPRELQRRVDSGELRPDFGPPRLDPAAGAVLVGARAPLIAFNVLLETTDVGIARAVAAAVRESSGGLPGVQAIGLELVSSRRAQVSMNLVDLERAALHEVVARVAAEAASRGVSVAGCELVGLLPAQAVVAAAAAAGTLGLPSLDASRVLELRLLEE
ncbi:MAG TPA: glutamate formimidoyltransferase [Gaiellaceae bacterium]|nr:glutamate formimidoyltransferase [Gaiellaceae bacterium]